jgi:hypothetical protein
LSMTPRTPRLRRMAIAEQILRLRAER